MDHVNEDMWITGISKGICSCLSKYSFSTKCSKNSYQVKYHYLERLNLEGRSGGRQIISTESIAKSRRIDVGTRGTCSKQRSALYIFIKSPYSLMKKSP